VFDKLDGMLLRYEELEGLIIDPEMMTFHGRYKALLAEHGGLRKLAERYRAFKKLQSSLAEAREIVAEDEEPEFVALARAEIGELEEQIAAETLALQDLLVSEDEEDHKNVIMELQAGTGGDEAAIFAGDLLRMYKRLADIRGWKVEVLNSRNSEAGGFRYVTVAVSGKKVYRDLKFESGGHRVQRVPDTESQGRIHTSLATVVVMPETEEVDFSLADEDLELSTFCASGPGGQHVNKTESAVRIVHMPTGLKVECQDEKSQHMNKAKAMRVLATRVADHYRAIQEKELGEKRRFLRGSGDRSQRIRTYNFPQNRISDHRIGLTLYSLDRFMEGDMKGLLEALHSHLKLVKLKDLSLGRS